MKKLKPIATLLIFAAGIAVAYPFAIKSIGDTYGLWKPEESFDTPESTGIPDVTTYIPGTTGTPDMTSMPGETSSPDVTSSPDGDITSQSPDSSSELPPETTSQPPATSAPETTAPAPVFDGFTTVDLSYFDDALFIGDSRTVGLRDYSVGNLKNATFFCTSGMIAGYAMRGEYEYTSGVDASGIKTKYGKTTLAALLAERKYGKIYIMLGINEMGDYVKNIVANIGYLADMVRQYQPDALIFLCANLHVTKEYSDNRVNKFISNEKIDQVNAGIAALADYRKTYYIDINEFFDDENHALTAPYSGDGVHVYGKYYRQWSEWLCTKGIVR